VAAVGDVDVATARVGEAERLLEHIEAADVTIEALGVTDVVDVTPPALSSAPRFCRRRDDANVLTGARLV
jgi:hypothetical protein